MERSAGPSGRPLQRVELLLDQALLLLKLLELGLEVLRVWRLVGAAALHRHRLVHTAVGWKCLRLEATLRLQQLRLLFHREGLGHRLLLRHLGLHRLRLESILEVVGLVLRGWLHLREALEHLLLLLDLVLHVLELLLVKQLLLLLQLQPQVLHRLHRLTHDGSALKSLQSRAVLMMSISRLRLCERVTLTLTLIRLKRHHGVTPVSHRPSPAGGRSTRVFIVGLAPKRGPPGPVAKVVFGGNNLSGTGGG